MTCPQGTAACITRQDLQKQALPASARQRLGLMGVCLMLVGLCGLALASQLKDLHSPASKQNADAKQNILPTASVCLLALASQLKDLHSLASQQNAGAKQYLLPTALACLRYASIESNKLK